MSRADAPRAVDRDVKVYSQNRKFYVRSRLKEQRTELYCTGKSKSPEWWIPGYAPVLFLSNDGQHLVEGYAGGGIFDEATKGSDALLIFFSGPRRVGTVTVDEMFPHREKLPASTSGRVWGNFWGFDGPTLFSLMLNDGHKVVFDAESGKRVGM